MWKKNANKSTEAWDRYEEKDANIKIKMLKTNKQQQKKTIDE